MRLPASASTWKNSVNARTTGGIWPRLSRVEVGQLLEVDDLAVEAVAPARATRGEGVEDQGELLGPDGLEKRVEVVEPPLELEAADGLADRAAVLEERAARLVGPGI